MEDSPSCVGAARMKWADCPNLKLRPRAPASGRGSTQRGVRRCFLVHGPEVTSSALCVPSPVIRANCAEGPQTT
jgi:hypothetical protein